MNTIAKFLLIVTASCLGLPLLRAETSKKATQEFPYVVEYELGDSEFASGDNIKIEGLRGTTGSIQPGGSYCVTGTYVLNSQNEADLCFFVTTTNKTPVPTEPGQAVRVTKGTGSFRLVQKMTEPGYLHLTLYSVTTGQGLGGVYFGKNAWVLRYKHFSYLNGASGSKETAPREPLSFSGPNQVLFDYLGNPVAPPPDMDTAYSKAGLLRGMQNAAQNAGISLARIEIDDSEFPFLVGVVFEKPGDKEKLKQEIGKLGTYASSGGVGGDTIYAMNIVPYNAFPKDSSQRIYRRMMLREAVLYDKIANLH